MTDPLAEVVSLLKPSAPFSKLVVASAPWAVRRTEMGHPFYFAVLQGSCRLVIDDPAGPQTLRLDEGDFALIPAARGFSASSLDRPPPRAHEPVDTPIAPTPGGARVGDPAGEVSVRMLVGHCVFESEDAQLLVPLLPRWVHVRGEARLATLVRLVGEESRTDRPAREVVMARLLEVLLIEALRSIDAAAASPGLVSGLSDPKLAIALRRMHERPDAPWTVDALAAEAALSRSAFFDRFQRVVGLPPREYLVGWRMALARRMLRQRELPIADIAERVGYGSVSAFGLAFTRHVGVPPGRYARGEDPPAAS